MIKITSFFLQAILVIIAVVLFSFFDPFGIMGSKKKTLVDTPITVASIKEIGKFISAEYYGEVLSSLSEISITQFDRDSTKKDVQELNTNFQHAIKEIKGKKKGLFWKDRLLTYFHDNYPEVMDDPYYDTYMEYLKTLYDESKEKNIIAKLSEDPALLSKIPQDINSKLKDTTHDLTANKKTSKQQIVLLGRGWVKAGLNFEKFTEHNFKYVPSHRTIYLIGMQPEILSCNINPWFIPEAGVKGFELVLYTGKANNPNLIKKVKEDCLGKLRQSAIDQNILGKAQENAQENLKAFFSLLVEGGINNVFFVEDTLEMYKSEILRDDVLKEDELAIIDSILSKTEAGSFDSAEVKSFMDTLKMKKFYFKNNIDTPTCYSSFVYKVTSDQAVDRLELNQLREMKKNIETPYPFEKFWLGESDTNNINRNKTRKKWFEMAVDLIEKNTNQLIESDTLRFAKNNKAKAKSDSIIIANTFNDLKLN